ATQLIVEICGGRAGPIGDVKGSMPRRDRVRVRPARVRRLLGIEIPDATIEAVFERLGFAYERHDDHFLVTPPSYRFDLAIEEDFVEEVARLYGYEEIPAVAAAHAQTMLRVAEDAVAPIAIKRDLVARGWQEVVTFSFVSSAWETAIFPESGPRTPPVAVLNPIASHLDVMRTTLAGGLIEVLSTNLARRQDRARIFEVGRCFARAGAGYEQPIRLGGLAYGDALPEQWGVAKRSVDLFDVKGDLDALMAPNAFTTERAEHPALHPGRAARLLLAGEEIGWLGELHPRVVR